MTTTAYIVRIGCILDSSDDEILWMTRHPNPPAGTVVACLSTAPTIAGSTLGTLDPVAQSGGMQWEAVAQSTNLAALRPLLRRDTDWPGSGSSPPRLTAYMDATTTTMRTTTPGLTGQVYVAGECMRITAEPSPGVYTVTRALGSLGIAREHRWQYGTTAPVILLRPQEARMLPCEVSEWDGTTETLVYRGRLRAASRTDHGVSLDITSALGALREVEWSNGQVPATRPDGSYRGANVVPDELTLDLSDAYSDTWSPSYARIWFGTSWAVIPVDDAIGFPIGAPDEVQWTTNSVGILQWGEGPAVYPLSVAPPGLPAEYGTPSRVESVYSTAADAPSQVLFALLTAQWPRGQVGGLDAADIGDLSAMDAAYGSGDLLPTFRVSGDWWPGTTEAKTLVDVLAKGLLQPLGLALTTDPQGRLTIIDWTRVLGDGEAVAESELMRGIIGPSDTTPVQVVRWMPVGSGTGPPVEWRSDLVAQVTGGGRTVDVSPGWVQDAGPWLTNRAGTILQIWQYGVPTVPVVLRSSDAIAKGIAPGRLLSLTCSTVWNQLGGRGVTGMTGVVLSSSRPLSSDGGIWTAVVALTGYSVPYTPGAWAPSAVVVSEAAGVFTLTMDDVEDVDFWFTPGTDVELTDATGLVLDSGTVTASTATTATIPGMIASGPGERIVLARYTTAVYPGTAYLSRGFDYV